MKSYASIDRFEGSYVVLEVEMHETLESNSLSYAERETRIIDVKLDVFPENDEEFYEGDIVLVEHDMEFVYKVYGKDDAEKERRIEFLKTLKL